MPVAEICADAICFCGPSQEAIRAASGNKSTAETAPDRCAPLYLAEIDGFLLQTNGLRGDRSAVAICSPVKASAGGGGGGIAAGAGVAGFVRGCFPLGPRQAEATFDQPLYREIYQCPPLNFKVDDSCGNPTWVRPDTTIQRVVKLFRKS